MLRTLRELSLRLAPLLLPLAARQAAPPAAHPAAPRDSAERRAYDFSAESQLGDFESRSGSWLVASGTLWCTSKGTHEELRWRRPLSARGSLKVTLTGAGCFALELGGEARVVALRWSPAALDVRVGDDEEVRAALPPEASAPFTTLSLVSVKSQPRLDDLSIERIATGSDATAAPGAVTSEDQQIALEQATRKLEAGDAAGALERVADQLPRDGAAAPLPPQLARLLQRIGARDEKLREKEPLKSRYAARVVKAQDGSASLVLPLDANVVVEAVEIHRTDGRVLALASKEPAWKLEVVRYDSKLQYWFGRDPRLVYCSGGGGPTLARARADEQKEFAPKSEWKRDVAKAGRPLDGETAWAYELLRPDGAREAGKTELQETFALHRGDTWRVTVEGDPNALALAADDIAFLLATFRFGGKSGGG